jgi:hypothetical protein
MFRRFDFEGSPVLVQEPEIRDPETASPLVLFLHGSGERGVDEWSALGHGLPAVAGRPEVARVRIAVPQCPPRWALDRLGRPPRVARRRARDCARRRHWVQHGGPGGMGARAAPPRARPSPFAHRGAPSPGDHGRRARARPPPRSDVGDSRPRRRACPRLGVGRRRHGACGDRPSPEIHALRGPFARRDERDRLTGGVEGESPAQPRKSIGRSRRRRLARQGEDARPLGPDPVRSPQPLELLLYFSARRSAELRRQL